MSDKKKPEAFQLPAGDAVYPKLDRPYTYDKAKQRSFPDPKGKYSTGVAVDAEVAGPTIAKLKAFAKEAGLKSVKNWPFKDEQDKETGEPTGRVIFNMKAYGSFQDGSPKKLPKFDAKASPLPADFRVTGGSTVRCRVIPNVYKELGGGVKLTVTHVQVLTLADNTYNPFEAEGDGFTYDGEATEANEDDNNVNEEDDDPTNF